MFELKKRDALGPVVVSSREKSQKVIDPRDTEFFELFGACFTDLREISYGCIELDICHDYTFLPEDGQYSESAQSPHFGDLAVHTARP